MIKSVSTRSFVLLLLAATWFAHAQSDPWPQADVIEPFALAKALHGPNPPLIVSVAFPVLYRNKHILHAIDAGAASRPEGLAALKNLVANFPVDAEIVIYCGCCPFEKCPNLRPAYLALKDKGFRRIRVLDIATNMHTDWYAKNYPSEPGSAAKSVEK